MIDASIDIDSLTNFKRQTAAYLKQLHETGAPVVLTVNGRAEVVVQDADAYRRLAERVAQIEREETVAGIREALADVEAGRTKPARAALRALAKKYGISTSDG
ncbi:MAG: type II toxin-antitoxin system Phd/YefM family antitoxin [Planctomycetes bacterium]|nr:type II toxin-antitoxin system Phd/YefM family antitoxin [Planctomycetota bacterium]